MEVRGVMKVSEESADKMLEVISKPRGISTSLKRAAKRHNKIKKSWGKVDVA